MQYIMKDAGVYFFHLYAVPFKSSDQLTITSQCRKWTFHCIRMITYSSTIVMKMHYRSIFAYILLYLFTNSDAVDRSRSSEVWWAHLQHNRERGRGSWPSPDAAGKNSATWWAAATFCCMKSPRLHFGTVQANVTELDVRLSYVAYVYTAPILPTLLMHHCNNFHFIKIWKCHNK